MKKIKEPGIYELSNEEYHEQEASNKSGLVQLAKSPAHFNEWYNAPNTVFRNKIYFRFLK